MAMKKLRWLALAMLSAGALSLTACNTVEGAGRDVESAGRGVQGASQEASEAMFGP